MLELLGPVVSLFKLFEEGLTKASEKLKSGHKKAILRKILEIQLSLEAIIDNAQEILCTIENSEKYNNRNQKKIVREIKNLVYQQHRRIHILLDQLYDNDSEEVMRLFAPDVRRNIIELIHLKNGVISNMFLMLRNNDDIEISGHQLLASLKPALLNWNHKKFLHEGYSYVKSLNISSVRSKIKISNHMQEQRAIVRALMECSKQLSTFIKSQISLEDII